MKNKLFLALGALVIFTLILGVFFSSRISTPKSVPVLTGSSFSASSISREVSVPGFNKNVLVPETFNADFTNQYQYSSGSGKLENDYMILYFRPSTLPVESTNDNRGETLIYNENLQIDATGKFELVDQDKQLYRSKFSQTNQIISYYQREKRGDSVYQFPFLTIKKTDTTYTGIYASVNLKKYDSTQDELSRNLLLTDKAVLQQLN